MELCKMAEETEREREEEIKWMAGEERRRKKTHKSISGYMEKPTKSVEQAGSFLFSYKLKNKSNKIQKNPSPIFHQSSRRTHQNEVAIWEEGVERLVGYQITIDNGGNGRKEPMGFEISRWGFEKKTKRRENYGKWLKETKHWTMNSENDGKGERGNFNFPLHRNKLLESVK